MQSRWSDDDARAFRERFASAGDDLALRVYTSRLIGQDPDLVMHGGGNTSVKLRRKDVLGDEVEAICVKGSGWDLDSIEPAGLPAMRLETKERYFAALSILVTRLDDTDKPLRDVLQETMAEAASMIFQELGS